jgi:hypothetical protein
MARHTRSLEAGMSRSRTPSGASALITALMTTGSAPTVPASPAPLAPSGLSLVGTGLLSMCMSQSVSARGIAYSMNEEVRSWPDSGSYTICSSRACPTPCATPPWIWPLSVTGLMTVPTSSMTT